MGPNCFRVKQEHVTSLADTRPHQCLPNSHMDWNLLQLGATSSMYPACHPPMQTFEYCATQIICAAYHGRHILCWIILTHRHGFSHLTEWRPHQRIEPPAYHDDNMNLRTPMQYSYILQWYCEDQQWLWWAVAVAVHPPMPSAYLQLVYHSTDEHQTSSSPKL